ncbi:hypothetical protein [Pengzhenrongella frigida]|uniref:hypothetical protein n=1 Tax=Pengzhenrongella frigida TaxID=1259133 RepID=UPI0013EC4973|nr:hypothetical protein [Cellulomonas sp. HLT2-17]
MSTDQPRPGQQSEPVRDDVQDTVPLDARNVIGPPADTQPTIELTTAASETKQFPTTEQYPTTEQHPTTEFVPPPTAPPATPAAAGPEPTTAAEPAAPAGSTAPRRPAPRVATVVWGLVIAVIGAGVLAAAAGYEFDVELASIALLALAGIGLVVGSIATSARRHSR